MLNFTRIFLLLAFLLAWAVPAAAQTPAPAISFACGENPLITELLSHTSLQKWAAWVEQLSGDKEVSISGVSTRITNRHSLTFTRPGSAFQFVLEQLQSWQSANQPISVQPFTITALPNDYETRNLIIDFPGAARPQEVVILSAHLDSLSTALEDPSPGADDNAVGAAALLEAARIFRFYRFERTVRLIFFSGEEQIEKGSQAYLSNLQPQQIVGVINLDMFGFDQDNDRCFEIHAGNLPASQAVGRCVAEAVQANQLNLTYDFLTSDAVPYSDHVSFWDAGIGAVLVLENYFAHNQPNGCRGVDFNPNYHTPNDRYQFLNLPYAFDIARAGLATTASMAVPLSQCLQGAQPLLSAGFIENQLRLVWDPVPGASLYRINQYTGACGQSVPVQFNAAGASWLAPLSAQSPHACYQVEAVAPHCVSQPSPARKPGQSPSSPWITGWRKKPGAIPVY